MIEVAFHLSEFFFSNHFSIVIAMLKKIIILQVLLLLFSCKKEKEKEGYQPEEDEKICYQGAVFDYVYPLDSTDYFKCYLDGKQFWRSLKADQYSLRKDVAINYRTQVPIFDPNNPTGFKGYSFIFGIIHKYYPGLFFQVSSTEATSIPEFIEKYLQPGPLEYRKKGLLTYETAEDLKGVMLFVSIPCDVTPTISGRIDFGTSDHDQSSSKLRCEKLEKVETETQIIYHLKLSFECNLHRHGVNQPVWKRLEKGELDIHIPVDK